MFILLPCDRLVDTEVSGFTIMTTNPPPYAPPPEESKGLYPSVPSDPQQHQQPSGYPQQPGPAGYYQPPRHGQPQPITIVQPPPVVHQQVQSFVVHIVLSCFVFWCCGCVCGLIAFILASKSITHHHYHHHHHHRPATGLRPLSPAIPIQIMLSL